MLWIPKKIIKFIFIFDDFDVELPQCCVCHVGPKTYAGKHGAHNVDRQGDSGEVILSFFGQNMVKYPHKGKDTVDYCKEKISQETKNCRVQD